MVLELLVNPGIDYTVIVGGQAADVASTYYFSKRDGIETESHNYVQGEMEKRDIGKALLIYFGG